MIAIIEFAENAVAALAVYVTKSRSEQTGSHERLHFGRIPRCSFLV
jgi:hypothetical protein